MVHWVSPAQLDQARCPDCGERVKHASWGWDDVDIDRSFDYNYVLVKGHCSCGRRFGVVYRPMEIVDYISGRSIETYRPENHELIVRKEEQARDIIAKVIKGANQSPNFPDNTEYEMADKLLKLLEGELEVKEEVE